MHDRHHTRPASQCTSFLHASCAALGDAAVLLTGRAGSGKSGLLLRLIEDGFDLVGDDRILLHEGMAAPPEELEGLLEIRGLGILRLPYRAPVRVRLHVALDEPVSHRLPERSIHPPTGAWSLSLKADRHDAVSVIRAALKCLDGRYTLLCGVNGGTHACKPFLSDTESV